MSNNTLLIALGVLVVLAIGYLAYNSNLVGNSSPEPVVVESFYNQEAPADMSVVSSGASH